MEMELDLEESFDDISAALNSALYCVEDQYRYTSTEVWEEQQYKDVDPETGQEYFVKMSVPVYKDDGDPRLKKLYEDLLRIRQQVVEAYKPFEKEFELAREYADHLSDLYDASSY